MRIQIIELNIACLEVYKFIYPNYLWGVIAVKKINNSPPYMSSSYQCSSPGQNYQLSRQTQNPIIVVQAFSL